MVPKLIFQKEYVKKCIFLKKQLQSFFIAFLDTCFLRVLDVLCYRVKRDSSFCALTVSPRADLRADFPFRIKKYLLGGLS